MQIALGRKLEKDEDVHHRNGNRLDFRLRNLQVLGHREHGWVSSRQRWFMKHKEEFEQSQWNEYFNTGEQEP